jgi:hypothetical protein
MNSIPLAANAAGMNAHGLSNPTKITVPRSENKHYQEKVLMYKYR